MDSVSAWGVDWSRYEQIKTEIESQIRIKIVEEIQDYSQMCIERGISNYFVSGLDVAAHIALVGKKNIGSEQTEVLL